MKRKMKRSGAGRSKIRGRREERGEEEHTEGI